MHFTFTFRQDAFRREVREILAVTWTPEFWGHRCVHREPAWAPEFFRPAAARGLFAASWPREYGDRAQGPLEQTISMGEMAYIGAPQEHHRPTIQLGGPWLMLYGSADQNQKYPAAIAVAEFGFAVGRSEPSSGFDLANVETRTTRDGDDFVLNGVNRYTSGAHYADYLWCVARTDLDAPKRRCISMFVVTVKVPGVDVVPPFDLQPTHYFNSVGLHDVRVPTDHLVGGENRGRHPNAQTVDSERSGGAHTCSAGRKTDLALEWVRTPGVQFQECDRPRLTAVAVIIKIAWLLGCLTAWVRTEGCSPTARRRWPSCSPRRAAKASPKSCFVSPGRAAFSPQVLPAEETGAPAILTPRPPQLDRARVKSQHNVIATRCLGLPRP